jgi:RND superfamily putative drug exporter
LLWTGEDALDRDLRVAGAREVAAAELRALPLSLLVALWAFRGLTGAVIATITGGAAVLLSLAGASVLAAVMPLTLLARGVASLLALALGLDYALLVLWRHREGAGAGVAAAIRTVRTAAIAVGAGVAPLVLIPVPELRTAGVAALVAVASAALAASTLTPALLGLLRAPAAAAEDPATRRWRPFVARVLRRPVLTLVLALPPLLALAWPAGRLRPAVHGLDWLPRSMESARALDALASMQRLGAALGLRVVLVLPTGSVLEPPGWQALDRLHAELERDERVTAVRSLVSATGGLPLRSVADILTDRTRRSFLSADGRTAVLELAAAERLDPRDVAELVDELRGLDVTAITGVHGARLLVGGAVAANVDYSAAIVDWLPLTAALVLAASLTVLALAFRSVLVPLKAVALNLLSVSAALGLATLVFQDGFGATPLGGLFPTVLVLAFCAAFGAGTDYEVFLVSRVAALRSELGDRAAIREGVARSAAVITGAAAVMVAVFVVFAMADLAPLRVLGFVLAVAIALDATLVRMVVAPALLALAGRWNWWPRSSPC